MTPTEIISAFDQHLPPDIAERAKKAYEAHPSKHPWNDKGYKTVIHIDWKSTDEGSFFWEGVYYGHFERARALLAPDYKEMWEKEKALREAAEARIYFMRPPEDNDKYDAAYNHYQTLKSKHNEN